MQLYYRDITGTYIHKDAMTKELREEFTIRNEKRDNMLRMGNYYSAKKMPEFIEFFKREGDYYKVPIGISGFLVSKFSLEGYGDQTLRTIPQLLRPSKEKQTDAIEKLLTRNVGLLHASTGVGKTQMILDMTARLQQNALIVVQNLTQMKQMVEDIKVVLGVTPMQISGKEMTKKDKEEAFESITVACISSRDKVNTRNYGIIFLDEADTYLGSDDRREWLLSLSPQYMYALTGTKKVNNMSDKVFKAFYGPTVELKLISMTPSYKQVFSQFEYYFDDSSKFHELKSQIYADESRNEFIIKKTIEHIEGVRKAVVFCEHVLHAEYLKKRFEEEGIKTFLLIGSVKDKDREVIRQELKDYKGPCIVVGSVKILGRGFDVPELSLGVLTTCEKFEANIDQYVGRIVRSHPTKPEPVFIDIVDVLCPILYNQAKQRIRNFTKKFPDGKILNPIKKLF